MVVRGCRCCLSAHPRLNVVLPVLGSRLGIYEMSPSQPDPCVCGWCRPPSCYVGRVCSVRGLVNGGHFNSASLVSSRNAQCVEDLSQAVAALVRVVRGQREVGCRERPLLVADIARVRFEVLHTPVYARVHNTPLGATRQERILLSKPATSRRLCTPRRARAAPRRSSGRRA